MNFVSGVKKIIQINVPNATLEGELTLPAGTRSLVIFSHGSGSGRFSPRNNNVASVLNSRRIGTFLPDLLTPEEDKTYENRFDIELLTDRLTEVTKLLVSDPMCSLLRLGYFGASTGAASAIRAAQKSGSLVKALVSRGGRCDLAIHAAYQLNVPTLLIVGSKDIQVLKLNREVFRIMHCEKSLEIVSGASHLFEEPGTLEKTANLAADWFEKYLQQ